MEFGHGFEDLARLARNAFVVCGAPDLLKTEMLAEFDAWVALQKEG